MTISQRRRNELKVCVCVWGGGEGGLAEQHTSGECARGVGAGGGVQGYPPPRNFEDYDVQDEFGYSSCTCLKKL